MVSKLLPTLFSATITCSLLLFSGCGGSVSDDIEDLFDDGADSGKVYGTEFASFTGLTKDDIRLLSITPSTDGNELPIYLSEAGSSVEIVNGGKTLFKVNLSEPQYPEVSGSNVTSVNTVTSCGSTSSTLYCLEFSDSEGHSELMKVKLKTSSSSSSDISSSSSVSSSSSSSSISSSSSSSSTVSSSSSSSSETSSSSSSSTVSSSSSSSSETSSSSSSSTVSSSSSSSSISSSSSSSSSSTSAIPGPPSVPSV